jgi:hypothetical protein
MDPPEGKMPEVLVLVCLPIGEAYAAAVDTREHCGDPEPFDRSDVEKPSRMPSSGDLFISSVRVKGQ